MVYGLHLILESRINRDVLISGGVGKLGRNKQGGHLLGVRKLILQNIEFKT